MKYDINHLEKGRVEVKVEVPAVDFSVAYKKIVGQLGQEVTIDGFRPGKIPQEVVEQKVGYNKVLNETASFLISSHLSDIFKKEGFVPVDSPNIALNSLTKGSPFSFTATFTQKPSVKVGDWKKIKVQKIKAKEISDQDVTESIKNIYEAWKSRKSDVGNQKSDKPDESKKFIYDAQGNKIFLKDDDKSQSDKESKIDDEFAKAIGARDLNHLRELVKKDLESIVADQVEIKFEQEIFEKLREIGQVEVPDILVEDELNRILVRLSTQLEKDGKILDDYLKEQKTTIDELKAKWRDQAEVNVNTSLILDQIGKDEKVQVSREEVDTALKGVSETNLSADQKEDLERYVVFSIFQSKTLVLVKKAASSSVAK